MILSQSTIRGFRLSLAVYNLCWAMSNLSPPTAFVIVTLGITVMALSLGATASGKTARRSAFGFALVWVMLAITLWAAGFFAPPCKLGAAPVDASGATAPARVSFETYSQYRNFDQQDSPNSVVGTPNHRIPTQSEPVKPTAGHPRRRRRSHPLRSRRASVSGAVDGRTQLGPARTRPEPEDANDVVYRELELRTPKTSPFDEVRARDSLVNLLSANLTSRSIDESRVVGQFPQNSSFP